jgi:hypothetical protein
MIHGLIHLFGFVKEWQLARINELDGKTLFPISGGLAKIMGVVWLLTCLLFLVSAGACLLRKDAWWMIAICAVIISEILIIIYWQDAKFGTIANVIVLAACILAYGTWNFNGIVKAELVSFEPISSQEKKVLTKEMTAKLPVVVQKWLERSNCIGKEMVETVHLKQQGFMKSKSDGAWMPVSAEQFFTVTHPGFMWVADVKAAPFVHLSGMDKYVDGKGHMLIKLLSLLPVVNASGKEIDQGAMLRYLAEIAWFPSAATSPYLTWEGIDSTSAKVTMNYGGISASGEFTFNPDGDIVSFAARRYYYRKQGSTLETWFIAIKEGSYREFQGIRIPAQSTVTWKFDTGDFTWFKVEITDIQYNTAQ